MRNLYVKIGLLVAVLSWLAYTIYWFFLSFGWIGRLSTYGLLNSLDILGTVGLGFRIAAALIAVLIVLKLFNKMASLIGLIRHALFMETLYALSLVPFAIFGILSPVLSLIVGDNSGISSGTGIIFLGTGIPYLVQAIVIPLGLFKLRSKLSLWSKLNAEAVKWSYVVGFFYIFFFWINYSMQWFIVLSGWTAPPTPARGIDYIMDYPVNMLSFLLTVVGLFAVMVFYLLSALPIIRNPTKKPDLRKVGVTLTGLGGYFAVQIALYSIFGFVGGDSIWTSVFFKHTVDLWCAALPALGIPLLFHKTLQE